MQEEAKTPKRDILGVVPKEHYLTRLHELFGVERHWYRKADTVVDGIPWHVEVIAAETVKPGRVIYGTNYSISFGDPFGDLGGGLRSC